MRIRIKNKYLILALIIFAASTGLIYASGGYYLYFKAEKAKNAEDYAAALAYYDALITRYPDHEYVPQALRETIELLADSRDRITARFRHNSSSRTIPPPGYEQLLESGTLTLEDRCWMLYEIIKAPDNSDVKFNGLNLVFEELGAIIEERDFAEAEQFYWNIIENREFKVLLEATERLILLYLQHDMLDQAMSVVEYAKSYAGSLSLMNEWLGHIYFAQGNFEQAEAMYAQGVSSWLSIQKLDMLRKIKANGTHLIEGVVTLNGAPFPGVKVLVYPNPEITETEHYRSISWSDRELFSVKTRNDGQFVLRLPDGEFEIGIELNRAQMELVDGMQLRIKNSTLSLHSQDPESARVEFSFIEPLRLIQPEPGFKYSGGPIFLEWTPYPEADYYQVIVTCVFSNPDGTEAAASAIAATVDATSIELDNLFDPPFFLIYDGDGIHPGSLLGRPDQIGIRIEAWTEAGEHLPANDALNLFDRPRETTWIAVNHGDLSPAEKLILERKYDAALELLQQKLAADPDNIGALWLLARFYYCGTYVTDHTNLVNFANRDLVKSLETLRRIEALDPNGRVQRMIEAVLRELEDGIK